MRNPFKKKALTVTPNVTQALSTGWNPLPMLGGGSRERIVEAFQTAKTANYDWLYRNSPSVRSVIDCIVRNVGQLELRLYEEIDDTERQPMYDHPAALSLRYPSETVPADQFIRTMFRDFLISDDAVAVMQNGTGQQITLKWVPITWVQFLGSNVFDTEVYRVQNPNNGLTTDFPAEVVLHWRGENPEEPRIGLSHLETLRDVLAEEAAMQQANIELAQSGMAEPSWVYRPLEAPEWSNDARRGFEQDLTNRIRRSSKTPIVLEEGMEMRSLGVSPKDAEALDLRQWIKGQVAAEYGVPPAMVGLDGDVEQARSMFYTDTLPPYCESFTKMLDQRLLVRVYNDTSLCFEFNLDEKHMGTDVLPSLVSASGRAVMLTNEARAKINLPPIDGGDELVTPLNVLVGDAPKPSPQVMGPQDPNAPPQDGSYRTDQPAPGPPPQPKQLKAQNGSILQLHPGRRADLERQHENIDRAIQAIVAHYDRLGRSLAQKAVTDWQRWDREFGLDMAKLARSIFAAEGSLYAFRLGGTFNPKLTVNYARAMGKGAADAINSTIRSDIAEYGVDGAMNQRDMHAQSAGAGFGAGATIWAREEAARQAPGTEHRVKVWIPDTERHAEFAGQTVPLGADWPAGFAPGTAPGCKCTMAIQ